MRLLICTQKVDVNDDVLGFFHRWLVEFSKYYDTVNVICLYEGDHDLPANVSVHSLGKEKGISKVGQLVRFYTYVWRHRKEYDRVFVHMNPEYVVLAGFLWRMLGKRIGLWYTHRAVNLKLRIAEKLSHSIFSAAGASFRLPTKKLHVLNHGIDTEAFACKGRDGLQTPLRIIVVGRVTLIKGDENIVEAGRILKERGVPFHIMFVGAPAVPADHIYGKKLHERVNEYALQDEISFAGSVPNREIKNKYCEAGIALNMVPTGGIDKTVLEAMAAGAIPITSNEAFGEHFGQYADVLIAKHNNPQDLAEKVIALTERNDTQDMRAYLKRVSKEKFDVVTLAKRITELL